MANDIHSQEAKHTLWLLNTQHLITKFTSVRPKWAVERDFMLPLVMTLSQTI